MSRRFGAVTVLDGLDLELGEAMVVALVGRNGSGKTTLLRILAGVLDPTSGEALVAGAPPGAGLATYVPAGDRMLNFRLTGARNLAFFGRLAGVPPGSLGEAIAGALEALDARALGERLVGSCSTGERRRLMLAVALVVGAPVLLLDEPFADLDDEAGEAVARACRAYAQAGGLVLYATPSQGLGPAADRTLHLVGGRLAGAA
ncbi:MAG: ATP-binding cassette domain-containing protein [Gemmatimonadales bacterium]